MDREKIRVLLVDDDQGDFEMTRAMLGSAERREFDYEIDWVATYEEGLDALKAEEYDVYLLDYFLEDRTGLDLLREVGRRGLSAPVIMLTGRGSRDVDLEAMRAGASDYLVKGQIDPELLERAIRYALERLRAQRALRESEERHRSMFDHLPIGLYRTTLSGEFIEANPALIRILGYPDRDTLQNGFARDLYVSSDDRARFVDLLERHGVARGFESVITRGDGTVLRVLNTSRLHRNPEGEVLYVEGSLEDITDLRGAEEARGSEARFRSIFELARLGIAILDLDALVSEANPAFCEVFETPAAKLRGIPFPELLVREEQPQILQELALISRGERDRSIGERRFQGPGVGVIWARTTITLVRNNAGEPDHLMVLLDDVADSMESPDASV